MSIDFSLLLVLLVAVCGALALLDFAVLAPRRRSAILLYQGQTLEPEPAVLDRLNREPLLVGWGKSLFPVLAIVLVIRSFLVEPFQIPTGSMRPTLEVGDFILTNKFIYGIRLPVLGSEIIPVTQPKRGDVMVFRYPIDPAVHYIKRVIGLPGDKIHYDQESKQLYINGQLIEEQRQEDEPGSLGSITWYREKLGETSHLIRKENGPTRYNPNTDCGACEWTVPPGYYFMMGDNRDGSHDSRYWENPYPSPELQGMVPERYIVGKAFTIWFTWPSPRLQNLPSLSRVGPIK
ncbi:S26 family signal peptidase [Ventosimonas gracilis]|uniref:Signal peptidase I n=1 Tax=Ventosimonas gracilis TaxID=1680762 RepID=A0A139SNY1_9GAMM|nr:signal peptidase I [Ventosimonas gracilis]KXU36151.1 S26 family signal peptidase [Ventosimonas gracilis]